MMPHQRFWLWVWFIFVAWPVTCITLVQIIALTR